MKGDWHSSYIWHYFLPVLKKLVVSEFSRTTNEQSFRETVLCNRETKVLLSDLASARHFRH